MSELCVSVPLLLLLTCCIPRAACCRFHLPDHLQLGNLKALAEKRASQHSEQVLSVQDSSEGSGLFALFAKEVDDSLTWEGLAWLRSITKLPIFIKVTRLPTLRTGCVLCKIVGLPTSQCMLMPSGIADSCANPNAACTLQVMFLYHYAGRVVASRCTVSRAVWS